MVTINPTEIIFYRTKKQKSYVVFKKKFILSYGSQFIIVITDKTITWLYYTNNVNSLAT
jgi:hypothetical protein